MAGSHLLRDALPLTRAVAKICSADTPVEDAKRSVLPSARHDDETLHLASEIGL